MLATARDQSGPRVVVEDSSGNAGHSMAAYRGRDKIGLQLFVPQDATSGALRQAEVYGATVDQSASTRLEAAKLAMAAVSKTQLYASHVYSPYFMAGVATMAYEVWEGMGRQGPANVVLPIGQGVLLLGLYHGFLRLKAAGLIKRLPRFFGVQSRACAPIYDAFNRGADATNPGGAGKTVARGVAIADPPRGAEVLAAMRVTKGAMLTVSDMELTRAQALMANVGWFVEPTAAVAVAGVVKLDKQIRSGESIVVPLTGTGLKI